MANPLGPIGPRGTLGAVLLAPALAATVALAAQQPVSSQDPVPNFDSRFGTSRPAASPDPQVLGAADRLRTERGAGGRIRFGADGLVRHYWAPMPTQGARQATPPDPAARRFLARHAAALGLDEDSIRSLVRAREVSSPGDPLMHVDFVQVAAGLRVFGAMVRVHLAPDGQVVSLSSSAARVPNPALEPALEPGDALAAALSHVRASFVHDAGPVSGPAGVSRRTVFARGALASDPSIELTWFPVADGARLAWHVVVEPPGPPQKYDVLIDAVTGDLLYRRNRVLYEQAQGRVLQSDVTQALDPRLGDESPSGSAASGPLDSPNGCPPVANHSLRSLVAPFRDPATVLFGTGRLAGNNVHVFRGATGLEGALGTLQADGSWLFDFEFGSPDSSETHLFFLSNFLHDFFYDLGFDEASGNFQEQNFGRGGLGGDSLFALARADGRNNATFEPKPDGESPIMSMFLWDGTGCWAADVDGDGAEDLDGSFDSDIVIHEYHHGVNHRLNTQFTGPEADAIGEGGSDFFAYSVNGDTRLAEYSYPPTGIRQVNGRTYGSWNCLFDIICEPHDNGEIFANVLWDLRERFRLDGVDGSDAAGVHAAHLLYIDGLEVSPPSPTMLDLRDAMLFADVVRRPSGDPGGSVNACRVWEVFALRGMGAAARDTNDTGTLSVVESTTMPAFCPALPPPATVTVTAFDATAMEAGADPGSFQVSRTGDTTRALTVYLDTPGGTAVEGVDYEPLPGTVVIPVGAASVTVAVVPIDDLKVENAETVSIALLGGPGYRIGSPGGAAVTIQSDDVAPDLVVSTMTGPTSAGAGTTLTVTETTKNQGTEDALASETHYLLSLDAQVGAGDVTLATRAVPPLAIGATSVATVALTVPSGTAIGTYYLIARADAGAAINESNETNNQRSIVVRIGPDLVVSSLVTPTSAAAGDTLTLTHTTKNQGGGPAAESTTLFFLSTNSTLDTGDLPLASSLTPALAPSATFSTATSVTIPASASAGTYYVLAQADGGAAVTEVLENNNVALDQIKVGPDLTVTTISGPTTAAPGQALTFTDTTKNQGGAPSMPSVTRLFLSTNSTLDAGDTPLGARDVPALAAGASSTGPTAITLPVTTTTGSYYVIAHADADSANGETSETNNTARVQVRVGPDLVVSELVVPATGEAGAALSVTQTVRNQGGAAAPASTARIYLSQNTALDAADTLLASRAVPALAGGATSRTTEHVTLPQDLAAGTYYIVVDADAMDAVVETNESNNTRAAAVRAGADLTVTSVTVSPSTSGAGLNVSITDATKNAGGATTVPTSTRLYLSRDGVFDAGDTALGNRAVPSLAPGATSTGSTPATIPDGTTAGLWYVIAVADAPDAVDETSETNNVRAVSIRVGPDLKVTSFRGPSAAAAGASITVTDTTANEGGGPAPSTTTRFYLSLNSTVDASDTLLGSRVVPALAATSSHGASTAIVVPAGLAPGRYFVLAVADGDASLPEVFENNNVGWILVTVQ